MHKTRLFLIFLCQEITSPEYNSPLIWSTIATHAFILKWTAYSWDHWWLSTEHHFPLLSHNEGLPLMQNKYYLPPDKSMHNLLQWQWLVLDSHDSATNICTALLLCLFVDLSTVFYVWCVLFNHFIRGNLSGIVANKWCHSVIVVGLEDWGITTTSQCFILAIPCIPYLLSWLALSDISINAYWWKYSNEVKMYFILSVFPRM